MIHRSVSVGANQIGIERSNTNGWKTDLFFVLGGFSNRLLDRLLHARISASGELILKFLDTASRVNVFQFACVKRMANGTNVHAEVTLCASCDKRISATASHGCFRIIRMDPVSHRF